MKPVKNHAPVDLDLEPPARRVLACAMLTAVWGGPSFIVAWILRFHVGGALLGLAAYFGVLVLVATRPFMGAQLRRPVVVRALTDTFAFRVATLVFPVGFGLDVICGGISVAIAEAITGPGRRRVELAFVATLFAGALLTVEFLLVYLVTYSSWLARGFPSRPEGRCERCGYDLRGAGSPRCPECGTATDSCIRRPGRTSTV